MAAKKEVVIVASKVKDAIKAKKFQTSGDLVEELSNRVHTMLEDATERAKKNGRRTVRAYDL